MGVMRLALGALSTRASQEAVREDCWRVVLGSACWLARLPQSYVSG